MVRLRTARSVHVREGTRSNTYHMLWTIAVILLILWALGLTTAYAASGLIHILLVLAIVVVLIRVIQGRRAI